MKVKISVIIVTRNRSEELKRLINSLSHSTEKGSETIIVDNSVRNIGLAAARNKGVRNAKGNYVLFIDDDNVVDPQMLANLSKDLQRYPHLVAVGPLTFYLRKPLSHWFISGFINLTTSKAEFESIIDPQKIIEKHLYPTQLLHNCFMVKKVVGDSVGWFDERLFMSGTEYDFLQRIRKMIPSAVFATDLEAVCYHDTPKLSTWNLRTLGFSNINRVYYFQRNRGVYTGRYGTIIDKIVLSFLFYPLFFIIYSLLFIVKLKFNFLLAHWKGTVAGEYYIWNELV